MIALTVGDRVRVVGGRETPERGDRAARLEHAVGRLGTVERVHGRCSDCEGATCPGCEGSVTVRFASAVVIVTRSGLTRTIAETLYADEVGRYPAGSQDAAVLPWTEGYP